MLDLDDDRDLVRRLVDHHAPHVNELWPDPDAMPQVPPSPDLERLVGLARAAATP